MRTFLTANWQYLLMLNYAVDPELLRPNIPPGVELDTWNGENYLSVVGFLFLRTKVFGVSVPLHSNFEEVNLRFYVRHRAADGWRRGVVFIKEIVPRRLIATVARTYYNEPYTVMPMTHSIETVNDKLPSGGSVEYAWCYRGNWNTISATTVGALQPVIESSKEEFITKHHWGYTTQPNGTCKEYHVAHDPWYVWQVRNAVLRCDIASIYGAQFSSPLSATPDSAFVADGSPITVSSGVTI